MSTKPQKNALAYLIADFRFLLALNRGTRVAGILMVFPVLGFRPFRAARLPTEKVPNPARETL